MSPFISVVIATRNRRELLSWTLAALDRQDWPRDRFEIVLADNGSTDDTRVVVDAARAKPGSATIQYLYIDEPGKSVAVNAALGVATGDIIAFTDDDVRPDAAWLSRIVSALDEANVDFVAGRVLPTWEVPPPTWISKALYGVLGIPDNGDCRIEIVPGGAETVVPIGANMAVRRRAIEQSGGLRVDLGKLDGTLRTGEDHEFFLRLLHAGCRGVYEPTAVVRHWVPAARLVRHYHRRWLYQNGRDVARLEALYPPKASRLFGIPRYLWRHAAADVFLVAQPWAHDTAGRFAATGRLGWLAGYLREAWSCAALAPIRQPPQYVLNDRAVTSRTSWSPLGRNWRQ